MIVIFFSGAFRCCIFVLNVINSQYISTCSLDLPPPLPPLTPNIRQRFCVKSAQCEKTPSLFSKVHIFLCDQTELKCDCVLHVMPPHYRQRALSPSLTWSSEFAPLFSSQAAFILQNLLVMPMPADAEEAKDSQWQVSG